MSEANIEEHQQTNAELFEIDVHVEFWNKTEKFNIEAFREKGELRFYVRHENYGEEEMGMDMELGRLRFLRHVLEHWLLMEENIASALESKNM